MEQTLQEFLGIAWPDRSRKPRAKGLTMVMDNGWPVSFVEGMMDQYGEYLDVVKIWDPHLRPPKKRCDARSTSTENTTSACNLAESLWR